MSPDPEPAVGTNSRVVQLRLCYKGERNYLQGGDLCDAVMEEVNRSLSGDVRRFQLVFHRFFTTQPDLLWLAAPAAQRDHGAAADFEVLSSTGKMSGWLVESTRQVECRIPFDEDRIAQRCVFSGQSVSIAGDTGYLPIEVAVSMTKQLHNKLLPANAGRWIFTKLDVLRMFRSSDATMLSVVLQHNLHGRLTKSEIAVRGESIGHIFFSLVRT